jgi:hypothetical protein
MLWYAMEEIKFKQKLPIDFKLISQMDNKWTAG